MRRGLMLWREQELSVANVRDRQHRLQAVMRDAGFDAILVYTNHVRPAAVTFLTGFTPYWADALLLVPVEGGMLFATALSKRVGKWMQAVNPTSEIAHSLQPGRLIGERLAATGSRRIGVVELDRLPGGLADEITSVASIELVDATEIFAKVRRQPDAAELGLARHADSIARNAFAGVDAAVKRAGDVTGSLERAVRLEGSEECYVAVAPDLARDLRPARIDGAAALGPLFAVRLSVAYNGVWIRRTETFARDLNWRAPLAAATDAFDRICRQIDLLAPLQPQLAAPASLELADWSIEAPVGTRPLQRVAMPGREPEAPLPYGILSATINVEGSALIAARPIGLSFPAEALDAAA